MLWLMDLVEEGSSRDATCPYCFVEIRSLPKDSQRLGTLQMASGIHRKHGTLLLEGRPEEGLWAVHLWKT